MDPKHPEIVQRLQRFARFTFLSPAAQLVLAKNDATVYDKAFLGPRKKKLSEFLLKEISVKSSMILTLWYALFDLIYLSPRLLDPTDRGYVEMCSRKFWQTLSLSYSSPLADKASLGTQKHAFDPRDLAKVVESRKIYENFIVKMDIMDAGIRELVVGRDVPLVLKEHYYRPKEELAKGGGPQIPKVTLSKPMKVEVPDLNKSDDLIDEKEELPTIGLAKASSEGEKDGEGLSTLEVEADGISQGHMERHSVTTNLRVDKQLGDIVKTMIGPPESTVQEREEDSVPLIGLSQPDAEALVAQKTVPLKSEVRLPKSLPIKPTKEAMFDTQVSVVFLLHGLEGSSEDLRNLQSLLMTRHQHHIFYRSEINEDNTSDSIETLGIKFAGEVRNFLEVYAHTSRVEVSFIGHSLGGLIARAALPLLKEYAASFKTYLSISSPHLGSLGSRFLVSTGMRVLSQMKNNRSIRQMTLDDEEQYLVVLSKQEGLGWFKNLIFVAVHEDGYVPYESSLVLGSWKNPNFHLTSEIAKNIFAQINPENLVRIQLHAPGVTKGLDKWIGRQAHLELLENPDLRELAFSHAMDFF